MVFIACTFSWICLSLKGKRTTWIYWDFDWNLDLLFQGNSISTTKYNILTFLPKGLFEQVNLFSTSEQ